MIRTSELPLSLLRDGDAELTIAERRPARLEDIPFGALQLDADGYVTDYRPLDGDLAGRVLDDPRGRHLFEELGAHTALAALEQRFREGVRRRELYEEVTHGYETEDGNVEVLFVLTFHQRSDSAWLFVAPSWRELLCA